MLLIVIAGPAVCVKLHNRGKPAVIMADSRWIKDNDWNLFARCALHLLGRGPGNYRNRIGATTIEEKFDRLAGVHRPPLPYPDLRESPSIARE